MIRMQAWPAPCLFGVAAHKALWPFLCTEHLSMQSSFIIAY
jgi:hypothetical protein